MVEAEVCRICGEEVVADARYCHACGAGLDRILVDLGSESEPASEPSDDGGLLSRVLVPVGVVAAVVALLALISQLGSGAEDRTGEEGADVAPTTTATPSTTEPDPTSTTAPSTTAPPSTTTTLVTPVDVALLPELDATHIVVRRPAELLFLDLETGQWTRSDLRSDAYETTQVGEGLVLALPSGGVTYASTDGTTTYVAGPEDGWLLGVSDDLILLSGTGQFVEARRIDGSSAWQAELPAGTWGIDLAGDGRIVVQANEWVALFDPRTETAQAISTGSFVGSVGDLVLVNTCGEDLDCGVDQIDLTTGDRRRVVDEFGWFDAGGGDTMLFYAQQEPSPVVYRLVDGLLVATDEPPDQLDASPVAVDSSGVMVTIEDGTLLFLDSAGALVSETAVPLRSCCRGLEIVLMAEAGSAT